MEPPALFLTRRAWCAAASTAAFGLAAGDAVVVPRMNGEALSVSAPGLRFLEGKPLDRLKDGVPVSFDFQLSLLAAGDRAPLRRAFERFTISYDLWEERFSAVRRGVLRQASRLTARAAESWCLDNLAVPTTGLARDRRVVVRLELRAADGNDSAPTRGDDGFSLTSLVDIFSRTARGRQPQWALETQAMRLDQVNGAGGK